jgi:hypothetical protein
MLMYMPCSRGVHVYVASMFMCGPCAQVGEKALASQLLLDGEPLDPAPPLTLMLHKPVGYVVTSPEDEMVTDLKVYDLLPYRCVHVWYACGCVSFIKVVELSSKLWWHTVHIDVCNLVVAVHAASGRNHLEGSMECSTTGIHSAHW